MTNLRRVAVRFRRVALRFRRPLAALAAGVAAFSLAQAASPPDPATTPVVVAARDLAGGITLTSADIRVVSMPTALAPGGTPSSASAVRGRVLAAPERAGEPVTDRRLVGDNLVAGYGPGLVASPVRIGDSDAVGLLEVGDHLDVYASGRDARGRGAVVTDVAVVAVPAPNDEPGAHQGALVVLAVTTDQAADLARASGEAVLTISLRAS